MKEKGGVREKGRERDEEDSERNKGKGRQQRKIQGEKE